jgi:hypothetical protein
MVIVGAADYLASPPKVRWLKRSDLERYCRQTEGDAQLLGGSAGPHSWRCRDESAPVRVESVGLNRLDVYCRSTFGRMWRLELANPDEPLGWRCFDSAKVPRVERWVSVVFDPSLRPIRVPGEDRVPVADTMNRWLTDDGFFNQFGRYPLPVYCYAAVTGTGAPDLMYGVVTPDGSRGFVGSFWAADRLNTDMLPRCT